MNETEQFVANALTSHFGQVVTVKQESNGDFRINDKLAYYVSNEFSLEAIPLGKKQYLYKVR